MITINYAFIIVVINFILLLIILNRLLYKPIKQFLSERQKKIEDDIDAAKTSKQEAQKLVEQKDTELKQSAEEIRKMQNLARKEAEKQADGIINTAKSLEKKLISDAEAQLKHEKIKVLREIESDITSYVADVSAKFLSEKISEEADKDFIKKIISESKDK
jgi:F-type H+-transporting ATPase subunit b